MKPMSPCLRWGRLFFVMFCFYSLSHANIIVNGDFSQGDSGWNDLGRYNGAEASWVVENNAYVIDVTAGGSEPWSIQLLQTGIQLDSGCAYTLSYELSCTIERTVEVSLSRNGADYLSYSGWDTCSLNPQLRRFERTFIMKAPSDGDARLEFNCGKALGKIALHNVSLVKITDPVLTISAPLEGELLYEGERTFISWSHMNVEGIVHAQLSIDNGVTWTLIDSAAVTSDTLYWIPQALFSPWCRIRVFSAGDTLVCALNDGPFEIVPRREQVRNGTFTGSVAPWDIMIDGGSATSGLCGDTAYRVLVESAAQEPWQIKLFQGGMVLLNGHHYLLSFTAASDSATDIGVNVTDATDPYTTYIDSAVSNITLSSEARRYMIEFTMNDLTDSTCRIEFNMGKSAGEIIIDDVSLTPQYKAPVRRQRQSSPLREVVCSPAATSHRVMRALTFDRSRKTALNGGSFPAFDLLGRSAPRRAGVEGAALQATDRSFGMVAPGFYLIRTKGRGR